MIGNASLNFTSASFLALLQARVKHKALVDLIFITSQSGTTQPGREPGREKLELKFLLVNPAICWIFASCASQRQNQGGSSPLKIKTNKITMNEENILIIGDDLAVEEPTHSTAAGKIATDDQSWLGSRGNAFAGNFLEKHNAEFQDFQRLEREKAACAEQFRALETELAGRRQWLESLQSDVADYRAIDLAADIFKNMELTGRPLLEIAQNPLLSGGALIQQHGKGILQLAEN
jgi:hypothetical protein